MCKREERWRDGFLYEGVMTWASDALKGSKYVFERL